MEAVPGAEAPGVVPSPRYRCCPAAMERNHKKRPRSVGGDDADFATQRARRRAEILPSDEDPSDDDEVAGMQRVDQEGISSSEGEGSSSEDEEEDEEEEEDSLPRSVSERSACTSEFTWLGMGTVPLPFPMADDPGRSSDSPTPRTATSPSV